MLKIRPAIRALLLGGVFFVLFLNIITYINAVSSQRNQNNTLIRQREQALLEQESFASDQIKETREEVNSNNRKENLTRINPNEIKRPIDIQREPEEANPEQGQSSSVEVGLVGR
jgi:ABC-type transport system involved in multi-copper enzyme maturation permease subunit